MAKKETNGHEQPQRRSIEAAYKSLEKVEHGILLNQEELKILLQRMELQTD